MDLLGAQTALEYDRVNAAVEGILVGLGAPWKRLPHIGTDEMIAVLDGCPTESN
jgi:hypothetical protein